MELSTDRLHLREFRRSDADWLFEYESDVENARYQSYEPRTRDSAASYAREASLASAEPARRVYEFVVERNGQPVGRTGLQLSDGGRQALVWYSFGRVHWGQGFATEAVRELIKFGFKGLSLHRVQAECDPRNEASVRLLNRLGFRREAHRVAAYWDGRAWSDSVEFAMLAAEFQKAGD